MNLNIFNTNNLFESTTNLFEQLGIKLNSNTAEPLLVKEVLKHHYKDNEAFRAIDKTYFIGIIDNTVFEATGIVNVNYSHKDAIEQGDKNYDGLMLFALELSKQPTRTEIFELTKAFNRISQKMPVALLLKYTVEGEALISIAISERFKYLQNWRQGEKVGKVIILRDIRTRETHAGHIRILHDLGNHQAKNFNQLHQCWLQALDVSILNKKFFQDLSNWYFAAMNEVSFPDDVEKNKEIRNATNLIRLITRVIFIWFIKEKQLVPASLFRKDFVADILKDFNQNKNSHNYYNAILQNLFFGTLNQKMEERKFAKEGDFYANRQEYGVKNLFRYANLFTIPEDKVLALFKDVPFLNGGLFDCLDKPKDDGKIEYVDGFSRNPAKRAIVPDYLFFGEEREVDLNEIYGTRNKSYKSRGLINLLESYKFTVAENTPIEEEVALDPELLGKVFENLLASYNPETQTTARKQTGSFYTPREIVNYMVDESLIEYLKSNLTIPGQESSEQNKDDFNTLETFFNPNEEIHIYTGNLPHWQQQNVWYFVTFRLADSIPADVAEKIKAEREIWLKKNQKNERGKYSKEQIKEYYRLFSDRIENLLNSGKGSCILKEPKIARIVAEALNHFNNIRYILDEWVIMPNHVHVLVKPLGEHKLHEITHSWKSYTANEINKVLGKKGQLWMHESYDHIVRNEKALNAIRNYVRQNPVKANLKDGSFLASWLFRSKDVSDFRSKDASDTLEGRLRQLLSYSEDPNPFNEAETKAIIEAINNCKILDPACGSGAFPMGILHKMVHILQKLDPENKYWKELQLKKAIEETEAAFKIGDKEERAQRLAEINDVFENNSSDYGRKLYLIENCIYGIDIQPIAVQIAKLRFFISLVIDQKVSPTSQLDNNRGIRPLPNLETKFVAANALIGLDKPQQLELRNPDIEVKENELKELRHQYFTANTRREKLALQKQDKKLRSEIAQMLENDGWETTVAKQIVAFDPYDQNHFANWFDPEWMFGIKVTESKVTESSGFGNVSATKSSGFDIIIGNPPYLRIQGIRDVDSHFADELSKRFKSATGAFDLYVLFVEKGLELIKANGILNFIMPVKWVNAAFGKGLRKIIIDQKAAYKIISFEAFQVFNAATYTGLHWFKRNSQFLSYYKLDHDLPDNAKLEQFLSQLNNKNFNKYPQENLKEEAWTLTDNLTETILEKIRKQPIKVKDVFEKIFQGIATSKDSVYFILNAENNGTTITGYSKELERNVTLEIGLVKPLLKGDQVHRYEKLKTNNYVIFPYKLQNGKAILYTEDELKKNFPLGYAYLKENEQVLRNRENGRLIQDDFWFRYIYPKNLTLFNKPKLICPDICLGGNYAYDSKGEFYDTTTLYGYIKHDNITCSYEYLLGLLNSNLVWYFLRNTGTVLANNYFRFMPRYVNEVPVYIPLQNQEQKIVDLVNQILSKKERGEDTSALEQQIDNLVYRLYDLTYEEVKVIDPEFRLSREEYEAIRLE